MRSTNYCRCAILCALFACSTAVVAEEVTGVVFHDINANGVFDAGEPPVAKVAVSNGEEVVLTDNQGKYALTLNDMGIVFVIKPGNWAVPVDPETRAPRGYYIHRPEGSPPLKFGGISPTGPLPENINFPLRPQAEAEPFKMLCLGDSQTRNLEEVNYLAQDLVADVVGTDASFGVTLGDIVFNDLSVFLPMAQATGMIGIPWHYVPGNHDMDFDAPTWQQTYETYQSVFGPPYYAFEYAKTHIFVLNNIRWSVEAGEYHGEFGERQRNFIANYLAHVPKERLLMFLMHIPVMSVDDRNEFFALFADYPKAVSLSAHWHRHEHYLLGSEDGWPGKEPHHHVVHGTACGAWYRGHYDAVGIPQAVMDDGTPKGYSIITVNNGKYTMEYRATRRPPTYQMDIYAPAWVERDAVAEQEVIVNFFNGTPKCNLTMRVNDGPWVKMEQYRGHAPFYAELYQRQELFLQKVAGVRGLADADEKTIRKIEDEFRPVMGRGQPDPAETGHLWRAMLPDNARGGYNVIEVRAADMFGNTHKAVRYFRVD
ncbi:MAG TPA: metallophosphoesterase [Candidatus Hydrogenedentes bacterium]|nr:metallophosphoesterase [Candidatus Hydrogenedentota bacterium]